MKKRILVVDDSQFLVTILASTLRNAGFLVDEASDVKEAVANLKEEGPPDLLVMDLNLPDMRGDEAVLALRKVPACQRLPVIFISGLSEQALSQVTRQVGASGYLKKPFSPSSILKWIRDNAELLEVMEAQKAAPASTPAPAPAAQPVAATPPPSQAPTQVVGMAPGEAGAPSPSRAQAEIDAPAAVEVAAPAPAAAVEIPAPAAGVEIPAPAVAAPAPSAAVSALDPMDQPGGTEVSGDVKDGCVLVIDDSSFLRSVLHDTLSSAGYSVALAENWNAGAEVLKAVRPSIVLLDVNLPDMMGDDACAILKHSAEGQNLPVYLISGGSEDALRAKQEASDADGYLRKPFTPVHVLDWLKTVNIFPGSGAAPIAGAEVAEAEVPEPAGDVEIPAPASGAPPPPQDSSELPTSGPDREKAIQVLTTQMLNPDPQLRAQAVYLLGQAQHTEALPQIRTMLMDKSAAVVADALYAIGEMKDLQGIGDVERLLNSKRETAQDLNVRMRAIESLGKIGEKKAMKVIAGCIGGDRPKDERVVAIQALADLGDEHVQEDLQRLMFEDDDEIQKIAMGALDRIRGRGAGEDPHSAAPPEPERESEPEPEPMSSTSPAPSSPPSMGDDLDSFLDGSGLDSIAPKRPEED